MAGARHHTAGDTRAFLRRLMREMAAEKPDAASVGVLGELRAAHNIATELDVLIDQLIVLARRREPVHAWREIGEAIGTTGQAAGQRARTRGLAVDRIQPEDYARLVAHGRDRAARSGEHRPES